MVVISKQINTPVQRKTKKCFFTQDSNTPLFLINSSITMDQVYLYEFIGTAVLVLMGDGVVANTVLKDTKSHGAG